VTPLNLRLLLATAFFRFLYSVFAGCCGIAACYFALNALPSTASDTVQIVTFLASLTFGYWVAARIIRAGVEWLQRYASRL
jgi:hypothetical protein